MTFPFLRSGLLLLALALVPSVAPAATDSILPDGTLEIMDRATDRPKGWPGDKAVSWPVEAGNRFLRIQSSTPGAMDKLRLLVPIPSDVRALEFTYRARVSQLKRGLEGMKAKLHELSSKRDELIARAKTAEAQTQVMDAMKSIDLLDPTSEISRFEEKIRREEAKVLGAQELAASTLDAQFEELEASDEALEVEARLAALKAGDSPKQVTSGE